LLLIPTLTNWRVRWLARLGLLWVAVQAAVAQPFAPVTWGESITVARGGWGRMTRLHDGSWLCVTTYFPRNTNSLLRLYRSTDACRTWTPQGELVEAGRTVDNGELVTLPNGDVLLTGRSLIAGQSYRLPVYRSADGGQTWRYRSNIDASEGLGRRGLWEPDCWVLEDGRLVVTYSNEKHEGYSQLISERVSSDNGATWGNEIRAVCEPGGGRLRPGMSQMARLADGHYILVYEVVGVGNGDVHFKLSPDGVAWPDGLGTRIAGQHCGPFVAALPDGRVFVTSCQNQIALSEDRGGTWRPTEPPPWDLGFKFSWPAIYAIGTNELGVMVVTGGGVKLRFGTLAPRGR
jgi:hypothetical protein